jgi:hypothetical protein
MWPPLGEEISCAKHPLKSHSWPQSRPQQSGLNPIAASALRGMESVHASLEGIKATRQGMESKMSF